MPRKSSYIDIEKNIADEVYRTKLKRVLGKSDEARASTRAQLIDQSRLDKQLEADIVSQSRLSAEVAKKLWSHVRESEKGNGLLYAYQTFCELESIFLD